MYNNSSLNAELFAFQVNNDSTLKKHFYSLEKMNRTIIDLGTNSLFHF